MDGVDNKTGDILCDIPMSKREIKNQIASGFGGSGAVSGRGYSQWSDDDYDYEQYDCDFGNYFQDSYGMHTRVEY